MAPKTRSHGRQSVGRTVLRLACTPTIHALEHRLFLAVHTPADGDALQAALNNAQLGDTIILQAGTTYKTSTTGGHGAGFTLRNKTTGTGWITIQSSAAAQLPEGVRVTPADAPKLARLTTRGSNVSVINTATSAHHYKFIGIEFVGPETGSLTAIMSLGSDGTSQSTYASVPHHIVIDRSYFRPHTPTQSIRRAVALNSAFTDILNSTIEEIHEPGSDSQAIGGWNGTGPYNIINNRLEGASENIMFGGGTHRIPGHTPSDIVIRGNHIIKPLHWRGAGYNVKNLFELKTGRRVLVEGNVMENCWSDGQSGVAIVLKLGNWSSSQHLTTEDIVFRNNIVRGAAGGVTIQGRDYSENSPPGLVRRFSFTNNVFDDINASWVSAGSIGGNFLYMTHGPLDVHFDHNTIINSRTTLIVDTPQYPTTGFRFTNNIIGHNRYGVWSDVGAGNPTFTKYFSDAGHAFTKNVLVDVYYSYRNNYTSRPGNFLLVGPSNLSANPALWDNVGFTDRAARDYRLTASSPYKNAGTDGKDVGANIDLLNMATAGALGGTWSSAFAYMQGNTLFLNFDGTSTPITLGTSGSNITATKNGTTLSFAGVTTIFAQGTPGDDVLQINGSIPHQLTFGNGNGLGDALKVLSSTHNVPLDLANPIRNVHVTVNAGANINFAATQRLASLTVNGQANLAAGGRKVIVTNALAVGGSGKLDLADNDLLLDYAAGAPDPLGTFNGTSYDGVMGLLASGYMGGSGIVSTTAGTTQGVTGLAAADPADVFFLSGTQTTLYEGQTVDASAVLIKYTYVGDTNLDGAIDGADYGQIDNWVQFPGASGYANGDFNYDGIIDGADYGMIDNSIQLQGAPL